MAYTPNTWSDRVGTGLNQFVDQNGTQYTFTPNPTSITQAGTPFSASWMNHIENGIASADQNASLAAYAPYYADGSSLGTKITTNIPDTDEAMFTLTILGNTYANNRFLSINISGYQYLQNTNSFLNVSAFSPDYPLSEMMVYNSGGFVCFWIPYISAYGSMYAFCFATNQTQTNMFANRITSINPSSQPTSGTRLTTILPSTSVEYARGMTTLNADTLKQKSGEYSLYNNASVATNDLGVLRVMVYSSDWVLQEWHPITADNSDTKVYKRKFYAGTTWTQWHLEVSYGTSNPSGGYPGDIYFKVV